jgi:hypothetical protein
LKEWGLSSEMGVLSNLPKNPKISIICHIPPFFQITQKWLNIPKLSSVTLSLRRRSKSNLSLFKEDLKSTVHKYFELIILMSLLLLLMFMSSK